LAKPTAVHKLGFSQLFHHFSFRCSYTHHAISVVKFHRFFTDKVEAVCAATAGGLPPTFTAAPVASSFTNFHKVTVDDVISTICRMSCVADTLPTPQLKLVADLIAPFPRELFNRSLSTAIVPTVFKSALITPLIKKPDLDSTDPRSYRPISNLSVVSKLLEHIIFRQLYSYLSTADLLPCLQSAYQTHHSTETVVLKVLTDILYILLTRLKVSFGIGAAHWTGFSPT